MDVSDTDAPNNPAKNTPATVALVLGIVSALFASIPFLGMPFGLPLAIAALVFATRAIRRARADERAGGRVRAYIAIALAVIVIAFAIVILVIIGLWATGDEALAPRFSMS